MDLRYIFYCIIRFLLFILFVFTIVKIMIEINNVIEFVSNIKVIYIK